MAGKQELIKQMSEMQKQFMEHGKENGVMPQEYYAAEEGHPLHNYSQQYRDMAMQAVEMAHAERGSVR